jgi:hypothetical protein
MTTELRRRVLETCRKTSLLLDEIQPTLIPWAAKDGTVRQLFEAAVARGKGPGQKFPREWIGMTAAQVAAGSVLRDPARIERYLGSDGRELSAEAAQFLRSLVKNPAFFTAFGVEEAQGEDLFLIRNYSTNGTELLCSSSMGDLFKERAPSYMTLLFSNGDCLQALGPMHYYRGFQSFDFHYYAKMLQLDAYEEAGLQAIMTAFPQDFVILDYLSEIPAIGHKGNLLYCCSTTLTVDSFDASALSASFDVKEANGKVQCRLKGTESPLEAAQLFWDPGKKELFIYTKSRAQFTRIALAIADQVEVPADPQWYATQNMEAAASMLLDRQLPVIEWEKDFQPPPPSREQKAVLERMNGLLKELIDATNHGRAYDLEKLAARHRLSMDVAKQAEEILLRQERSMSIDIAGGLAGIPPLPPSQRMKMKGRLAHCPLFRFNTGDEPQRLFKNVGTRIEALRGKQHVSRARTMLTLATLPAILEEIDDAGDDTEHTLLKCSLYLLLHAGGEFQGTADYAAEILKNFWQVLLDSSERAEIRRFTKQYAIWCREVLLRAGLAEEEPAAGQAPGAGTAGAAFRLKASAFFTAWVKPGV